MSQFANRDVQLRYWHVFEAVRALYRSCTDYTEDSEQVSFRFRFPTPTDLQDALDTFSYRQLPYFYRKAEQLFDPHVDVFIELSNRQVWDSMFGMYDSRRRSLSSRR